MPFYIKGAESEVVGIEDAAKALILAGERGRNGERYIISERFMSAEDIYKTACAAVGVTPPKYGVPMWIMSAMGAVAEGAAKLARRDTRLTPLTVRLMHIMSPMDHSKAVRELGWQPSPTTAAIADAAQFFLRGPST